MEKGIVATRIEDEVDTIEDRVESELKLAEKLGIRETAMRRVCGIIAGIALVIEVLFFLAAAYGLVGGICMRYGFSEKIAIWRNTKESPILDILIPLNSFARDNPRMNPQGVVFFFHMSLFFMSLQWGFIVECIRRIFANISFGQTPFAKKNIKNLLICSILVFFSCFVQPILILLLLMLIALILIFQYGNVLQQKADSTISDQEHIIFSLAEITEAKSGQTGQHVKRVSEYSRVLSSAMGLSAAKTEEIRLASVLHDIGKLMIDSRILDKPGKLTDEEYAVIKTHVDYGDKLLESVDSTVLATARIIARDHHERWDGKGYSSGRSGTDISLEGRIVAVADVFDALCSKRSYKEAWTLEDAYNEIVKQSGSQFDPAVVAAFTTKWPDIQAIAEQYR